MRLYYNNSVYTVVSAKALYFGVRFNLMNGLYVEVLTKSIDESLQMLNQITTQGYIFLEDAYSYCLD